MVNSVTAPITQPIKPLAGQNTTKTSIFYINDEHSNVPNMEKLKSASDDFDSFTSSTDTSKLKFSSGDFAMGGDLKLNKLAVAAQNSLGIMASAEGNHEHDIDEKDLLEILKDSKYKLLGLNTNIPSDKELSKKITKSYIQEQNGVKYGVIGLAPFDLTYHLKDADRYKHLNIIDIEKTIPLLQKEIDDLQKQGINKIVVLSHAGYTSDVQIAKAVEGVDVILGGHSHDLIKGITEGKNLFYSKKSGEPTIITQAGKNGDHFGVLNLEFNDKGVITSAQNNVSDTADFPKSSLMDFFVNKILGPAEVVGSIKSASKYSSSMIVENPHAEFMADAVRSELNTDIVMLNSGNFRGGFEVGKLTDRDIFGITPLKNNLGIIKLSEKELVDAIKVGAQSMNTPDNAPGLLQFSGIKYTVSKSGELKALSFIDKDGKETAIDIKNPNTFKTYTVALDDFVAKGGNNYMTNKWDTAEKQFDVDKNKFVIDHIKKSNAPIEIKEDGRIQIVD